MVMQKTISARRRHFVLLLVLITLGLIESNAEPLRYVGQADTEPWAFPLSKCEGHCENDIHCKIGLSCRKRKPGMPVRGCEGSDSRGTNYCYKPPPGVLVRKGSNGKPKTAFPLGNCEGACRNDADCKSGLSCFERTSHEKVPGCKGLGVIKGMNYCVKLPASNKGHILSHKGRCTSSKPCSRCQGHCANSNNNCKPGLICFSRTEKQSIPGCKRGGSGDVSGIDYCTKPPPGKPVTYLPGKVGVKENGLLLSKGLRGRVIARTGEPVLFANGRKSLEKFHRDPDGAAVFADKKSGGWIYVSNSEKDRVGGVGAITFDAKGNVVGYKKLLSETNRNCGGGRTYWDTWLSCEEVADGQIWEVDPWGRWPPRKTLIGGKGDRYEAAAFDNRNKREPKFFVTVDLADGPLVRFSPDEQAVAEALKDGRKYRDLLHSNKNGTAMFHYLVLKPSHSNPWKGSFHWTRKEKEGRRSAFKYFQNSEGIDIRFGKLYFVSLMNPKSLFILNLDDLTFEREATKSGAFSSAPDQLGRINGNDNSILYFSEGGSKNSSGVHGRDANGNFFTILETVGDNEGDTTGIAFSPDNKKMYFSNQDPGRIYEITRKDGYPFGGQVIDIQYHSKHNVFDLN